MPKKAESVEVKEEKIAETADEVLIPFNVIIDGQDMTIRARDQKDLDEKVAKIRKQ